MLEKLIKIKQDVKEAASRLDAVNKKFHADVDQVKKQKWDEERALRDKFYAMEKEITEQKDKNLNQIHQEVDHVFEDNVKYTKAFEMACILQQLGEPIVSWASDVKKAEKVLDTVDTKLIQAKAYIIKNNKPKNKFDLRVDVFYRHRRLDNFFKIGYRDKLLVKSFPRLKDAEAYYDKNRRSILDSLYEKEDEALNLVNLVKGYNPKEEFDCTMVDVSYSGSKLAQQDKDSFTIEMWDYKENVRTDIFVKATFKGNGAFQLEMNAPEEYREQCRKAVEETLSSNRTIFIDNPVLEFRDQKVKQS